jgi:hypothetical protein
VKFQKFAVIAVYFQKTPTFNKKTFKQEKIKMPAINQDGFFFLKTDWNATYQETAELFLMQNVEY